MRAVSAPPATLPDAAEERAAIWQDLTRFHDAAGDLGRVVTQVLTAAFARWQELNDPFSELLEQARRLLQRNGGPSSELVAAFGRFEQAVGEIPRPPAGLPATAAQVLDTARAMGRLVAAQREADRAQSDLLKLAVRQWDAWIADAERKGSAAAALLPYTGPAEADLRNRLNVAVPALPASLGSSMVEQSVQNTWHALQRLADLEHVTSDVFGAATDLNGLRSRVAAEPDLVKAARAMVLYTGERQAWLSNRLDEAEALVNDARPSWWPASGPELTTVADIELAAQWLAGDGPDMLLEAVEELEGVVIDVPFIANRTAERLERLVRRANELLPDTGAQQATLGLQLFRAGGTPAGTQFSAPRWAELRPGTPEEAAATAAQMRVAAAEHAAFRPSAERLEDVASRVIGAAIAEWQTRLATARTLLGRLNALTGSVEMQRMIQTDLSGTRRRALIFADALNQLNWLDGPHTAADMDAAARKLDQMTFDYQSVEKAIREAIGAVLDEPMRVAKAAAGLAEQMDGLLSHVGEDLRNDLLAQRAAWAAVPTFSSVLSQSRRGRWRSGTRRCRRA